MFRFSLEAGEGRHRVRLDCLSLGRDLCLCLGGGEQPHVGAMALAGPFGERIFELPGHREGELALEAARRSAAALGRTVSVAAGLHVYRADKEDIRLLLENSFAVLERGLDRLQREAEQERGSGLDFELE
jgi:hypothetical protein